MCIDHRKDNIRVNIVCRGDINAPMLKSECEQLGGPYNQQYLGECADRPIARLGTVEDVANAVVFFASDMSSSISGAHLAKMTTDKVWTTASTYLSCVNQRVSPLNSGSRLGYCG